MRIQDNISALSTWFEDVHGSPYRSGKGIPDRAVTSMPMMEPCIVTKSGAYLSRRQASPDRVLDGQGLPMYRKHLGTAPAPNVDDRVSRTKFLPVPKAPEDRPHGVSRPGVPGWPSTEYVFEPGALPHRRQLPGRSITYSTNKEVSLDDILQRRRHVHREDFYGKGGLLPPVPACSAPLTFARRRTGYAGDYTTMRSRAEGHGRARLDLSEDLYMNRVDSPTYQRYVKTLPPSSSMTANARHVEGLIRKEREYRWVAVFLGRPSPAAKTPLPPCQQGGGACNGQQPGPSRAVK